jgi:hypothetical protein
METSKLTLGRLIFLIAFLGILGLALVYGGMLGVLFATASLWLFFVVFMAPMDRAPWEASRFVISLLVAWLLDLFLFKIVVTNAPESYRHLVPGIIVVSILGGYLSWRLCLNAVEVNARNAESSDPESTNPFKWFGGFLVAIFVMANVISPIMYHYMPVRWSQAINFSGLMDDDSSDNLPGSAPNP